jgi:hypothetical protein
MLETKQGSTLSRRVVHLITQYLEPKEIFSLITKKEYDYSVLIQSEYGCRDRALMAMCFASAGRITEVVGGPQRKMEEINGKRVVKKVGKHPGLHVENLKVTEDYILVSGMKVVKRSQKLLAKYGDQIAIRDDFTIPLKCGLFDNPFWDQLVPFGWLILEYLVRYAPKHGKLFPYEDTRAYQIVRQTTGMFPHWFRAQAEHFYGYHLITDSLKLSKFVKLTDPKHIKHYVGYDWKEQLKDASLSLDFKWIEKAILDIHKRIGTVDTSKEQGFQQQNAIPFQKPSIEKAFVNLQECAEGHGSRAFQQVPILKQSNRTKEEDFQQKTVSEGEQLIEGAIEKGPGSPEIHVNKASQVEEETPLNHEINSFQTATSKLGSGEASQSQTCKFYSFSRGLVECMSKLAEKNVIFRGTQEVCDECWNDPRCPGKKNGIPVS